MKNIFLILIFSLFISGCASTRPDVFEVSVDSINSPASHKLKSYIILPNNVGVKEYDLQFQEYAIYVERALNSQGFIKANDLNQANVAIFLGYGIGDPETHKSTYSIPTWGKTGIASSNTHGTVNIYGNTATVSSKTTYTPTYGVTGSTTKTSSHVTYKRFLSISAIDLNKYKEDESEKQIWKTLAVSSGYSDDLRRVLPVLVAASSPYISKNSGQKIKISLKDEDQQVLDIKGIQANK